MLSCAEATPVPRVACGAAGSAEEGLKGRFVADRVEVRVVPGQLAAAVPHVDRLSEVLDGFGYLAPKTLAAGGVEVEVRLVGALLDELAALRRRLGVLAGLVEGPRRVPPQLRGKLANRIWQVHPRVTPRVVARFRRRWKRGVGERTDGHDNQVRFRRLRREDLRAAGRAEVEDPFLPIRLSGDTPEVTEAPVHLHLVALECRLDPERASRTPLAGAAVTDRDRERVARDLKAKLAAVTGGFARLHRGNLDDDHVLKRHSRTPAQAGVTSPAIISPMPLFSITAVVEADDRRDAETVLDAISRAICPHPDHSGHACPRGWMTMMHELDEADAAVWAEPEALNR